MYKRRESAVVSIYVEKQSRSVELRESKQKPKETLKERQRELNKQTDYRSLLVLKKVIKGEKRERELLTDVNDTSCR